LAIGELATIIPAAYDKGCIVVGMFIVVTMVKHGRASDLMVFPDIGGDSEE
jgi:hypothetical protein